jgi:outer membrane protein assembly factor BamB
MTGRQRHSILSLHLLALLTLLGAAGCKKGQRPSADKYISAFVLTAGGNPGVISADVYGLIGADTIQLGLPQNTVLTSLIPTITFTGKRLSPPGNSAQDFTKPVLYTVTAADGSVKTYTVVVNLLSGVKAITSFVFRATDNPGLTADITGFVGNDTITVPFGAAANLTALVPFITYTGKSISPSSGTAADFTAPVLYTVTAADGSTKRYTVILEMNLTLYAGSDDGYLYALDATTGVLKWKYATGGAIRSSPTLYNGTIYFGSGDGYFYALDSANGSLHWKYQTAGACNSSPTVANGTVYFNMPGWLVGLDALTGQVKSQFATDDQYATTQSPTVANGIVYDEAFEGLFTIGAVDAATGGLDWNFQNGSSTSNPAVVGGKVYAGDEFDQLVVLDAMTGTILFRYNLFSQGNPTAFGSGTGPTVTNGKIYTASYTGYIYAFDSATYSLLWTAGSYNALSGSVGISGDIGIFSSPVVSGGILFAGNNDSKIYAFDAITGASKWVYDNENNTATAGTTNPTVAGGMVYCGGYANNIVALSASTGTPVWSFQTNGGVYSGPCIVDAKGRIFHPGASGDQQ